ncbi:MAG: 30S ribosomal protein S1 [Thiovulaceae bacterium]|nr:30S ribosomal protein S1 [Sulfurimonadaceae bacterium]
MKHADQMMEGQEDDFASMFEEYEKQSNKKSRKTEGEIVEIQEDVALVGVGDKLEGILPLSEISDEEGNLKYNKGDKIEVIVTGHRNERPVISHKKVLEQAKMSEFIEAHKDDFEEILIEGKITRKNRGGYVVTADGVDFFMPRSLAALKDIEDNMGKKIKARVVKLDADESSIVVSRKKYLGEERKRKKGLIDEIMAEDKILKGTIKKITSYGMFVDVGGVDGLVHYNEISYKGPVNPAKLYSEGDEVECKAISYDKDKRHLSLSIKAVMSDPWEEINTELEEGDTITVTVSNIEAYGAFVDLGNDIEGFLHISEISWDKHIKSPKEYLEVDQEIDVEVIEIDPVKHKLRVSLKSLLPKPFEEFTKNYKEGDIVTGTISTLTDFGAFIKIGGIEGLLPNQDLSWEKNTKCKDVLTVGDEIEVKISKIHADTEKISLNRKTLEESPIDKFSQNHKVNDIIKGKVRDVKDFGVFVSLEDGVDALIRTEDLEPLNAEELEKDQEIEAVIVAIDTKRDRIRLSVKKLERMEDAKILQEVNAKEDSGNTLGDLIKDQLG